MNKDVIYVEPDDDITDIISRVRQSKQKVVALVPPKKIGVLRSAVNTKLIAKTAKEKGKVAVIVTQDQSLIKLAAAAKIPVASSLQSRPKLPSEILEREESASHEQIIDEKDFDDEAEGEAPKAPAKATPVKKEAVKPVEKKAEKTADQEITSDDIEEDEKKSDKKAKKDKKEIPALEKYRNYIIAGAVAFVLLLGFIIFKLVYVPDVTVSVSIRTTSNNFSENVTFVDKTGTENAQEGKFLLETQTATSENSVEFEATGKADKGDKASGSLNVNVTLSTANNSITIPAGTEFSHGELTYVTTKDAGPYTIAENCDPQEILAVALGGTCTVSDIVVSAQAAASGTDYNISSNSGWTSKLGSVAVAASNFSGGTTKMVTVVQQSDIDKAKEGLDTSTQDMKSDLKEKFGEGMVAIEASYKSENSDPTPSVALGEEATGKVKLTVKTTYTMYGVDKTAMEDYVKKVVSGKIGSDQKIYEVNDMFFERFQDDKGNYTGKFKATALSGPTVTEADILEKVKGRKNGDAQSLLKSINGVSKVEVSPSVNSIPDDSNKITIELKVES